MSRYPRYTDAEPVDEIDGSLEPPSKSARKRAAHAAQALGERLIGLKEADLARVPLPETLRDAVREARRIKARGGLVRQKQYIGKLMRELDPQPIEAALDALR